MPLFEVGDAVVWTSQAKGHAREKVGEVAEVVGAGHRPSRERFPALYKHAGCGYGRKHQSYVVLVGNRPYWPNVVHLREGHGLVRAIVAAQRSRRA